MHLNKLQKFHMEGYGNGKWSLEQPLLKKEVF